jgi:hypothetical protein
LPRPSSGHQKGGRRDGTASILEAETVVFVLSSLNQPGGNITWRNAQDTMSINAGSIPHAESA